MECSDTLMNPDAFSQLGIISTNPVSPYLAFLNLQLSNGNKNLHEKIQKFLEAEVSDPEELYLEDKPVKSF